MLQGLSKDEIKAEIASQHTAELILLDNYPSSVTELVEFNETVLISTILKTAVFTLQMNYYNQEHNNAVVRGHNCNEMNSNDTEIVLWINWCELMHCLFETAHVICESCRFFVVPGWWTYWLCYD